MRGTREEDKEMLDTRGERAPRMRDAPGELDLPRGQREQRAPQCRERGEMDANVLQQTPSTPRNAPRKLMHNELHVRGLCPGKSQSFCCKVGAETGSRFLLC